MSTYEAIKLEGKLEGIIEGELKGKLEGIIEGELKGKTDIIFSLTDDGFDVPHIARIVKMTIDEVQNILKSRLV